MNKLTLSAQFANQATELSNIFIDKYMPLANGEFIKVYIYLLRCVADNQTTISVSALADFFNQTEADIVRALRYWDKVGAIILAFDGDHNNLSGITFCDLSAAQQNAGTDMDYAAVSGMQPAPIMVEANPLLPSAGAKSSDAAFPHMDFVDVSKRYTPSRIQELSSKEDFGILLYAVSAYLGSTLSPTDMSSIAYLYDTLHFPADLIDYLVEYCVSKGKRSMRYIERVALNWADAGVRTTADAKAYNASRSDISYAVLNAFGITGRTAGKTEQDFIHKWSDVYCFDSDIIIEACNRTLRATHQPSFEYADSILAKWREANVKTAEDIKKADAQYEKNRQNRFGKRSGNPPAKSANRFNNFHQRDMDVDSLEHTLLSNNG